MKPHALIIGGTSGLGREIAQQLCGTYDVSVTGRKGPSLSHVRFYEKHLQAGLPVFGKALDHLVRESPHINLLVYAAGFYQEGPIDTLTDEHIHEMHSIGLLAPALLLQRILKKQHQLDGFIAVTSSSQYTPRPLEPVYTSVKAGLGMLAHSISLDERVGKTLVVAPQGMQTAFWRATDKDTSTMLDPTWVAAQVLTLYEISSRYCSAKILRNPARVEIIDSRA